MVWIASATDLARFMVRVDRNGTIADIVPASLLLPHYFGGNWTFYGSLPGTSTVLSRMNNNYSFVILANTRTESNANVILDDLNNTLKAQITAMTNWPVNDLFN